ncbi:MAG: DUF4270 family protein [Chitinophagaceae bacterium]
MNFRTVKSKLSVIFFSIIFFAACTKIVTTDIGAGLIPPIDGVVTKDTSLEVLSVNAGDSSIRPSLGDDHVLGYVNDPLFGKTSATINVQLQPSYFPYSFGINKSQLILDSVVLALSYKGVWGDSTKTVALRVFQITDSKPFNADSSYSNTFNLQATAQLTQNNTAVLVNPITLKDSFHVFVDSGINQIRIRLDTSIGHIFLHVFDSTNAYKNDTTFNQAFKGFQISANPSDNPLMNALLKINLLDTANTKLAIYYRYPDPVTLGKQDTAVRYFIAGNFAFDTLGLPHYASAHSNYILRDRSMAEIAKHYPEPAGTVSDSLLYLQAQPGVFTKIRIPLLSGFPNVIIHRAELLMEQIPDNANASEQYLTPPALFLAAYNFDSSRRFFLFNDVFNVFTGSSGTPDLTTFGSFPINIFAPPNKIYYRYNINITRYVQDIVTKKDPNYNLILYAPFHDYYIYPSALSATPYPMFSNPLNSPACGRIRLAGGSYSDPTKRMRLHIIYSLIK